MNGKRPLFAWFDDTTALYNIQKTHWNIHFLYGVKCARFMHHSATFFLSTFNLFIPLLTIEWVIQTRSYGNDQMNIQELWIPWAVKMVIFIWIRHNLNGFHNIISSLSL